MHFKNNLALVTGGATGIGRAVGFALAHEGSRVLLVDIDAQGVLKTSREISELGLSAEGLACDLADDTAVAQLGRDITERFGVPDLIFNNAYVGMSGSVDAINMADWRKTFEVNLFGYVRVIDAFVHRMISRGSGHIVNTASPMGIAPDVNAGSFLAPYMASKAAIISLSQSMALRLRQLGIGVSLFFPDVTKSVSVNNVPGTAPAAFKQALKDVINSGASPDSAALALMDGLKADAFFISADPRLRESLAQVVRQGLDPQPQMAKAE